MVPLLRSVPRVAPFVVVALSAVSTAWAQSGTTTQTRPPTNSSTPAATTTTSSAALPPAAPDPPDRVRLRFGPQVGTYLPASSKTRDRFGDAWLLLGIGIGNPSDMHKDRHGALDISVLSNSRNGAKALIIPVGFSYNLALNHAPEGKSVGYAGVSADLVFARLRSDRDNLATTNSLTAGGGVFIGTRFGERGYVEARYNAFSPTHGFDLSGLTLMTGLRF